MSLTGRTLGAYHLHAKLGEGGMGTVYRAHDARLGRDVALKVLPDDVAGDSDRLARFEREARALAALNHPNIVTIYSVEAIDGTHLLTMELVEGQTLDQLVQPGGLPIEAFLDLAVPLADALAAAHDRGITHRDLKPGNVMVRSDGTLKVLDFGLARLDPAGTSEADTVAALTSAGMVVGTPSYMAPEQASGQTADARSDLFSLGTIFYELIAGRRLFDAESVAGVLASILRDTPPSLSTVRTDVPEPLSRLVRRCLEKDPRRRVQAALDVRNELDELRLERRTGCGSGPPAATPAAIETVAVLPLGNLSGQPAEEYFADGMTEALMTDLAKIGGLRVISRGSVMGFKGTTRSATDIGRELGVHAVVEGSVLRAGDRVRISARLVRVDSGEYLWAERYDRGLADVLALQDEVARAIATAVDRTLRGATPAAARKVNPEAYLLHLRARHYWHQRTEASFRAALELFEDAIAGDPTYAPAYVGLAESLIMLANYGLVAPRQIHARSLAALQQALALDEASAAAHRVLALVRWQLEFNWLEAIAEYERALELDPNSPDVAYWFGLYLGVIGRFARSHELLERAQTLDPLSLVVPSVAGWVRFFAREFEAALPFFRQVLSLNPNFHLALWFQGEALVELGRFDEGLASLERAYELAGRTARLRAYLGYAQGRAGATDRARESLADLEARAASGYAPPYFLALVRAGLGETEQALDDLERAYADGDTMLRDLKADPHWDRMHEHPRFAALMQRLAYPPPG